MDNQPCPQEKEFTNQLLAAGLLIGCGVPGVFAKGRGFEEVLEALDRLISATTMTDGAEFMRFPPIINRRSFERSEFLNSLPHLAGSVFSFSGTEEQHRELVRRLQVAAEQVQRQRVAVVLDAALLQVVVRALGHAAVAQQLGAFGRRQRRHRDLQVARAQPGL